jgi:hypothetical protein
MLEIHQAFREFFCAVKRKRDRSKPILPYEALPLVGAFSYLDKLGGKR